MDWAPIVTAISTAAIAVVAIGLTVFAMPLFRSVGRLSATLDQLLVSLERDAVPLLESTKSMVSDASQVAAKLRDEVDGIVDTSREVRDRVMNAVDATEDRLLDLEALLDVLQDEVEDTVLDVAAALRTTRRGAAIFGAMRRAFLGSGKKRKRKRRR